MDELKNNYSIIINIKTNNILTLEEKADAIGICGFLKAYSADDLFPRFKDVDKSTIISIPRKNLHGIKFILVRFDWIEIEYISKYFNLVATSIDDLFFAHECTKIYLGQSAYKSIELLKEYHRLHAANYQRSERNSTVDLPQKPLSVSEPNIPKLELQKNKNIPPDLPDLKIEPIKIDAPKTETPVLRESKKFNPQDFLLNAQMLKNKIFKLAYLHHYKGTTNDFPSAVSFLRDESIISRKLSDELIFVNRNRNRLAHPECKEDTFIDDYVIDIIERNIQDIDKLL